MPSRSEKPAEKLRLALMLAACASCGTLGSPSRGDVDLPTSLLGPFRPIRGLETPEGFGIEIRASNGVASLDDPTVVVRNGQRTLYASWIDGADRFIARAGPAMQPAGTATNAPSPFAIEGFARVVIRAEHAWQMGGVTSPAAALDGDTIVIAYSAGGALGFARATNAEGSTFEVRAAPMLTADATQGESGPLSQPSLARAPTGEWFLAYESAGAIFLARGPRPDGPWTRIDTVPGGVRDPVVAPTPGTMPADAGASMDGGAPGVPTRYGDPALAVLETPTGRTTYRVFFTVHGVENATFVGAAASWDVSCTGADAAHPCFARVETPVFAVTRTFLRAGAFDRYDTRIALLWVGSGTGTASRSISAGLSPADLELAPWAPRDR